MIKQAIALSWINFRSFPHRLVTSGVSILSIACVSAMILSVLALTDGMIKTMQKSGLDDSVLIMRSGATSELQSVLFGMEVNLLANNSAIARDTNKAPIHSAEMFVNAEYKRTGEKSESLSLRGVEKRTYFFRPNFKIIKGKAFKPGLREIMIGAAIARRMPELKVGNPVKLGSSEWVISGIFSDKNSVFESEVWADLKTVQNDYQRGNSIQSVRLALKPGADLTLLKKEWIDDPRLNVKVIREKVYFAEQAESLTRLIRWVGFPVAVIMALGALIAALNTMYAAVSNRSQEIATHKAIGFSPIAISISIISEALLLAFVGGLLGILPLYVIFDDWTASTTGMNNLSQMMFNFDINFVLMGQAMALSIFIGLIGGVLPAIKAMRLPVCLALREV